MPLQYDHCSLKSTLNLLISVGMTENETLIIVMQCSEIESSKYNYKELSEGEAELDIICNAREIE